MKPHRVTHDPADPQFPHGTNAGYNRGCRRDCCLRGHNRVQVKNKVRRMHNNGVATVGPPMVRAHIRRLIDETGAAISGVSRAFGLADMTTTRILNGTANVVRADTARRILGTTVADVRATPGIMVNGAKTYQQIHSMQAMGYSLEWQKAQLAVPGKPLYALRSVRGESKVFTHLANAVDALAQRVDGTQGPDRRAASLARLHGWHPLAAYDNDGKLIPEAVDTDSAEAQAAEAMRVIWQAAKGVGNERIAAEIGMPFGRVRAYRAAAGLKMERDGQKYKHRSPRRAKEVLDICRSYDFEGWTAMQALEKIGVPLIEVRKYQKAS